MFYLNQNLDRFCRKCVSSNHQTTVRVLTSNSARQFPSPNDYQTTRNVRATIVRDNTYRPRTPAGCSKSGQQQRANACSDASPRRCTNAVKSSARVLLTSRHWDHPVAVATRILSGRRIARRFKSLAARRT